MQQAPPFALNAQSLRFVFAQDDWNSRDPIEAPPFCTRRAIVDAQNGQSIDEFFISPASETLLAEC